jgi:hypothetical protein
LVADRPPESTAAATSTAAAEPLVQRLPWDFQNTYPEPLPTAIDEGVLENDDPETVKWIHDEHAREALAALVELDVVLDARRRGVDPRNNKKPMLPQAKERLQTFFEKEPARLEHWYRTLMATYDEAFGENAARAFEKAIRAWHAGIEVTAEKPAAALPPPAVEPTPTKSPAQARSPRNYARVIARLPVPKPLPSAVAAGHFGHDEGGRPIKPEPMEVRVITERHAEKLIDISDSIQQASGSCVPGEADRLRGLFQSAIAAYAEDFGEHAARQLEAYVHRQAGLDSGNRRER